MDSEIGSELGRDLARSWVVKAPNLLFLSFALRAVLVARF